jgi:hypothetical protein
MEEDFRAGAEKGNISLKFERTKRRILKDGR